MNIFSKKLLLHSMGGGVESYKIPEEPFCFRIDITNADPSDAIEYYGNCVDCTPAKMNYSLVESSEEFYYDVYSGELDYGSWKNAFFLPRPVMLKYDGTVDYELDHNDFTKKLDGSPSDIDNVSYEGNCMIAFPQVWLKFEAEDNYQYVYIASKNIDGNYHCYSHYNNNGDLLDEIFVQAFEPCCVDGKLRSLADRPILTSTPGTDMWEYAKANGNGWDFLDLGTIQMIQMLFILMFKTLDSQSAAGTGSGGESTAGSTKNKPMFYDTYNNSTIAGNGRVKVFGIEDLWGGNYKWINGFLAYNYMVYYKLCNWTADGSTGIGYDPTSIEPVGYKSYYMDSFLDVIYYRLTLPNTDDGLMWHYGDHENLNPGYNNNTEYCDRMAFATWMTDSLPSVAIYAGNIDLRDFGIFNVLMDDTTIFSASYTNVAASLSCKPY